MPTYDPIRIQNFLAERVDLQDFCFILQHRVRAQYAFRNLVGAAPSAKGITLVQQALKNDELGEIVFQLIRYWLERGNPQVLVQEGLYEDLDLYRQELEAECGDKDKLALVVELLVTVNTRPTRENPEVPQERTGDPPTGNDKSTNRPTVFVSYSHKDESEKDALLSQLGVLVNADLIDLWTDDRIGAGDPWESNIRHAIARAQIAVLLISANFLTSDYILRVEVPELMRRRKEDNLTVFPVIAKECAWEQVEWLAKMNVRPKNGRPIWRDRGIHADRELAGIALELAEIIKRTGTQ